MFVFTKEDLLLYKAKEKEWLLTNGLGGYSSSTIIGLATRKHHGLLVSSFNDSCYLLLSKVEEEIVLGNKAFSLGINKYSGNVYQPLGNTYLEGFVFTSYPTFNYNVEGIDIIKSVCMVHGKNALIVSYKFISPKHFKFLVKPFINCREITTTLENPAFVFNQHASQKTTVLRPSYEGSPVLIMGSDRAHYRQRGVWIENIIYEKDSFEDSSLKDMHFCPGEFFLDVQKGMSSVSFLIVGDVADEAYVTFDQYYSLDSVSYLSFFQQETHRLKYLLKNCSHSLKKDPLLSSLFQTSDSFLLKDQFNEKSILSGYHSGYDSPRDAFLSLPGLCLILGRNEDAQEILLHYSRYFKAGLFPEKIGSELEYRSVDTPLWFIYACYKFYKYTNNLHFIRLHLWDKIKEIITTYKYRSLLGFGMRKDGLISLEGELCLTWMTGLKRKGVCVEINALWYNALKIAELFAKRFHEDFEEYLVLSTLVKTSFDLVFWNEEDSCLYDLVDGSVKDSSVRPNQVFAVSLPFRLLTVKKEYLVVKKVTEELFIPYGLRSLTRKDMRYSGFYQGKDKISFNGVAFGWLLGFYITAYLRIHHSSKLGKEEAYKKILKAVVHSLKDYGVGTLNELYDGSRSYRSRGNISSAVSVAEIIRAYVEDVLEKR